MAKIGDIVRFLNSVGGGRITRIEGKIAYVDDDGFETPVLLKECVVVSSAPTVAKSQPVVTEVGSKTSVPAASASTKEQDEHIVVEETPEGENLNVQIVYEPTDIKRLSTSRFDTYIVNDSNYTLYVSYLTRDKDEEKYTSRFIGTVDAGIVLYLETITREDLPDLDRVTVQLLAYKPGKSFEVKNPVSVERRVDTTKFAKLHCFGPNPYFDTNVITLDIVTNDVPYRQVSVSAEEFEKGLIKKANADRREQPDLRKIDKKQATKEELVVDLHIHELVDDMRGLTNADMLNIQIDAFRKVMDENRRNHGRKIVFIHGKGEGVLRNALIKELNYRYKGCDAQDASFLEYGFGATQVTIK